MSINVMSINYEQQMGLWVVTPINSCTEGHDISNCQLIFLHRESQTYMHEEGLNIIRLEVCVR